jgi:hypothetical protein
MITRAQAEALLTLAEALEACERLEIKLTVNADIGQAEIDYAFRDRKEQMNALDLRCALDRVCPKAAPDPLPAQIAELRRRSGEGILACRKAIDAHPNDLDGATEHLRCAGQAVVRGPGALQPCGCPHLKHTGS